MFRYPHARILVMARAPVPGRAKTRLIPALGEAGAADLHRRLVERLLGSLQQAAIAPVQLWCTPDSRAPFFQDCARRYAVDLHQQAGEDLGQRMAQALLAALAEDGVESALVVGCDIPALDGELLAQACEVLHAGNDAVLLPMEDGGYGLLGLRQMAHELFTDLPWGSDAVLGQTRQRLSALQWQWEELETLWDVDRPEDLARLAGFEHRCGGHGPPYGTGRACR